MDMILCLGPNDELGNKNSLIYRIPEDMAQFKKKTEHGTVIMGMKTFDSLSGPLSNRKNIVLSSKHDKVPGVVFSHSKEEILSIIDSENVFVIGGASVYKLFEDCIDNIYLTRILNRSAEHDTSYTIPLDKFVIETESKIYFYKNIIYKYEKWTSLKEN
jgi:dihydrofolate reductase